MEHRGSAGTVRPCSGYVAISRLRSDSAMAVASAGRRAVRQPDPPSLGRDRRSAHAHARPARVSRPAYDDRSCSRVASRRAATHPAGGNRTERGSAQMRKRWRAMTRSVGGGSRWSSQEKWPCPAGSSTAETSATSVATKGRANASSLTGTLGDAETKTGGWAIIFVQHTRPTSQVVPGDSVDR